MINLEKLETLIKETQAHLEELKQYKKDVPKDFLLDYQLVEERIKGRLDILKRIKKTSKD